MKAYVSLAFRNEAHAIDTEKCVYSRERRSLVAVEEWMVLCKTFPWRSRFFDQVLIVTSLWPVEGGHEYSKISHPVRPPKRSIWSACIASTSAIVR